MSPALRAAEPLATAPSDGRGGKACRRCQDDADLLIVQTSMEFSQTSNVRVFGNDTDLPTGSIDPLLWSVDYHPSQHHLGVCS